MKKLKPTHHTHDRDHALELDPAFEFSQNKRKSKMKRTKTSAIKKRYSTTLTMIATTLLTLTLLVAAPIKAEQASVYHTVVFWLKPDTTDAKVAEIIRSAKAMQDLPMVEKVLIGTPIMSDRQVVDDSFSVAFTMIFKDEDALRAFALDPHHKKISSEITMPHVARGVIYDYKAD